MSTSLQTELPLSAARLRRPLVDAAGARTLLDVENWQLERLLDAGKIRGVWDIASPKAERQELRLLAVACMEHLKELTVEREDAELARLIFGLPEPLVRVQRIYARFNCHPTHLYDLVREKALKLAKGSMQRPGPGGSAVVEWTELLRFLKVRRRG